MTDAGVSGEGTQSAKALPPNNPTMNSAISQRWVIEIPDRRGLSHHRAQPKIYVQVHQLQAARGEASALVGLTQAGLPLPCLMLRRRHRAGTGANKHQASC